MKRPLIGCPSSLNNFLGIPPKYVEYLSYFGDVIALPLTKSFVPVDLLVLPGGADIDPSRQNLDRMTTYGGNSNRFYEFFDTQVLPLYLEALEAEQIKGIFGICRGMQSLNITFGGSLWQHLYDEPYNLPEERHKKIQKGTTLNLPFPFTTNISYNSLHHQAVRELGAGLVPILRNSNHTTTETGESVQLIEGFRHKTLNLYGLQYHPEETNCGFATKIINTILHG